MGYCTTTEIREGLTYQYWKPAHKLIAEDGYTVDVDSDPVTFADEAVFLQKYVDRWTAYIDDFAGGPFAPSALLKDINRVLAIYDVERYVQSAQAERIISISIVAEQQRVMKLLQRIYDGELSVLPASSDSSTNPFIVTSNDTEGDCGEPLTLDGLNHNFLPGPYSQPANGFPPGRPPYRC